MQGLPVSSDRRFERTGEATPNFGGEIARSIVKPIARLGQNITGKMDDSGKIDSRQSNYLGTIKPVGNSGDFGKDVLDSIGVGAEIGSNLIGGTGAGAVAKTGLKGLVKQGVTTGARAGIGAGATYGLGAGLQDQKDKNVGQILGNTAIQTVKGGAIGGLAGGVLGGAVAPIVKPSILLPKSSATKAVSKTENELLKIENNYQKLRKNAKFSKDGNAATRKRIAQTGVMTDATDDTGTIITDKIIPKYRALSPINNTEGVVRKNLERLGETVDLDTVENKLLKSVYDSGLQGANLESAVNTVKKEIAGYRLRANPDGRVPLTLMHDAKIDVYNSIDFNTPAEIKAYKKTLAKGLKEVVEENSSFNVKEVNETLAPYLKDIEYLESLNGRKVKGGKLGKYSARIAGNIAGGIAGGSVGGLPGSAVGTIVGGEVGDVIQGKILKNTFGRTAETALPESKILKKAVQTGNSPRLQLPAGNKDAPRIRIESGRTINLPKRTQSTADAQSLANLKAQKIAPPSNIPSKVSISKTIPEKKTKPKLSLKDQRGFIATGYKETGNLTTKILKDLEGKTTVSKQYILDATNRGELKQVERDITRNVLDTMPGDTINVKEFADKVKAELLQLKRIDASGTSQFATENVVLPDEIRGNVKNYMDVNYTSPIKTSAGEIHFNKGGNNYFGHTRIEDMADNKTRRVIEVQSDLYQKGNLEREFSEEAIDKFGAKAYDKSSGSLKDAVNAENIARQARRTDAQKLQQYNDPTAHFRMIREEIKKASQDGKDKLQFPTGETAMKIEKLGQGEANRFIELYDDIETPGGMRPSGHRVLKDKNLEVGMRIAEDGDHGSQWIITDVLGDGKFKAVPKDVYDRANEIVKAKMQGNSDPNYSFTHENVPNFASSQETFDISGKVDTNNPIYKFYEKDVAKYLNKFGGKRVVDDKGVSWIEIPITKEQGKAPVEAFGKSTPNVLLWGAGLSLVGVAGTGAIKKRKNGK